MLGLQIREMRRKMEEVLLEIRELHLSILRDISELGKVVRADVKSAKRAALSVRQSQAYHNDRIVQTLEEQGLKTQEQLVDYLTKKGWVCFKP